jgi:hypothetical protein
VLYPARTPVASERGAKTSRSRQRAIPTNRRGTCKELSCSTLHLVRIAQTAGEHFQRSEKNCVEGTTLADKRHRKQAAVSKDQRRIATAVARELLGFIGAIGTRAETIPRQRAAAVAKASSKENPRLPVATRSTRCFATWCTFIASPGSGT